jgi:lipid-binding SYLF domain-containing protein
MPVGELEKLHKKENERMKKNLLLATMVTGLLIVGCDKGEKEAVTPKSEESAVVVEKTEDVVKSPEKSKEAGAPKATESAAVTEKTPEEAEKMVGEKSEIDSRADAALDRFYTTVDGAREFAKTAKGLLVMPNVKKVAFLVGGEYGEGALRIDDKTVGYYNTVAASFGLQIGAQGKDFIVAFMTDEALEKFRNSRGWEAGVDGNIAFIKVGGGDRLDTHTGKEAIVGFVFDVKGLMADVSLKGAKFTRINK